MFAYDSYAVYCDWCIEHHRSVPTRAWWEAACLKNVEGKLVYRDLRLDQAEVDREAREGWAR